MSFGFDDFDKAFTNFMDNVIDEQLSKGMEEYNKNMTRPGIDTLSFAPVPKEQAEKLKKKRAGLFSGRTRKQLIASILEGRMRWAEVAVISMTAKDLDYDGSVDDDYKRLKSTYKYFYKMADLKGEVLREDASM